jgi:hypothetical protein
MRHCVQQLVYFPGILAGPAARQDWPACGTCLAQGGAHVWPRVVHMFGPGWCTRGRIYFMLTCTSILPGACALGSAHVVSPLVALNV